MSRRKKKPRLEDLIPNEEARNYVKEALYSGKRWFGPEGSFTELLQSFVDSSLEGEMDVHLEEDRAQGISNRRNGYGRKTVKTEGGQLHLSPPRDREGTFSPTIVEKRQRQLKTGLDETILSLYAKGNSVDDISRLLHEIYGVRYSTGAISQITDRVWTDVIAWQQRPLQCCYAIMYLDGIHFRVKEQGVFKQKCVYSLYGIDCQGQRDILGLYMDEVESANTWGLILEDLRNRGVEDIIFACIDGLKGFKSSIEQVFPQTIVQRCIVHKIRNSLRFISDKEKKPICADLRTVYGAADEGQAKIALEAFRIKWGKHGERIAKSWEQDWEELMAFMAFGKHIRRMIYTTNPVEAVHRIIRKATKTKGAWISEKALTKQLYLTITRNEKSWKKAAYHWNAIQIELIDKFGDRYTQWVEQ